MEMKHERIESMTLCNVLDMLIEADLKMDFKSAIGTEGEVPFFTKFHFTNIVKQYLIYNPNIKLNIEDCFNEYLALGIIKEVPTESKYGLNNPYEDVYYFVPNSKSKIKMPKKRKEPDVPQAVKDNMEWWNG